jgi:hypothetical protein
MKHSLTGRIHGSTGRCIDRNVILHIILFLRFQTYDIRPKRPILSRRRCRLQRILQNPHLSHLPIRNLRLDRKWRREHHVQRFRAVSHLVEHSYILPVIEICVDPKVLTYSDLVYCAEHFQYGVWASILFYAGVGKDLLELGIN